MFNQKLQATENIEFEIAEELRYETDPCELKLDEMIEAEPEPEMIEGLPASDALTPADRYLELFEHVQSTRLFADSKTFPDCAPKMDPLDILIRYRKVRRHRDFDLARFVENHFWLPEDYSKEYVSDPGFSLKEHIDNLWPVLTREPQDHIPWSSLLELRYRKLYCAAGAAAGLYCARRAIQRDLLLGFLFLHAGAGRKRS